MGVKSLGFSLVLYLIVFGAGCGNQRPLPVSQVSPTNNVQVALYSVSTKEQGNFSVQFGLDTNYGLTTWPQPRAPTPRLCDASFGR